MLCFRNVSFVAVCSTFVQTFINAFVYVFYMVNCPACGKWFASEFHMKGHLRLSNDYRHVAYTGKKISRKPKRKLSEKPLKQTDSALWEAISRVEAKLEELNKTQQQPAMKTETPIASSNPPRPSDNELLERITRLETNLDMLNKTQQQSVTKPETPVATANPPRQSSDYLLEFLSQVNMKENELKKLPQQIVIKYATPAVSPTVSQPKLPNWREYTNADKSLYDRQNRFFSDDRLNKMVADGMPPENVLDHAKWKAHLYDNDDER